VDEQAREGAQEVTLSAEGRHYRTAGSGMEHCHNGYKAPEGFYISGGHNGLAQSLCAHMGGLNYAG